MSDRAADDGDRHPVRIGLADGIEHELDARGNTEFFENAEQIFLDGVFAEGKLHGNLAVAEPLGDQADDLLLPRRKQRSAQRIHEHQSRDAGDEAEQEVEMGRADPDLSGGDAQDAFAKIVEGMISEGKDAARTSTEGGNDQIAFGGIHEKDFADQRMRLMQGT